MRGEEFYSRPGVSEYGHSSFAVDVDEIFKMLVRVFITDLILRHSAEVVETYSQSTENACVYKEFCNTKGI